jgi:hypothetical protein
MEVNLAYEWSSDPLLIYALTLTALLFGGILFLIATIIFKHGRRLKSQKTQEHFASLMNHAKVSLSEGKSIQAKITQINTLIELYEKDVVFGWVRLLEKTPIAERNQYISIASQTNILHCVSHCLNAGGITEKCIALEAIGLSNFGGFADDIKKYIKHESIAPYACITLARLTGKDSLPLIIESYGLGFLSTTQALSAIVEVPQDQVIGYLKNQTSNVIPEALSKYLAVN